MPTRSVSVIGLGKLGAPMVAAMASRGFHAIGVDVNPKAVEAMNAGRAPVFEPHLAEYIRKNKKRIRATTDIEDAVLNSDITFMIVPTPSTPRGDFTTKYLKAAAAEVGKALKNKKHFHVVLVSSTVLPGATERDIIPILEKTSGKVCGLDFGVGYNPEFIALGNVIHDLLHPDFVLVGHSDPKTGDILEDFYSRFSLSNPPVRKMRIVNAELTKIAVNTYVTNKISFANLLAEMCERLPGGDVDEVTQAVGLDSRIGRKYLRGGLGFGGPCFPRDNRAMAHAFRQVGLSHDLARATDNVNKRHTQFIADKITALVPRGGSVAVLGLSYKPDTNVIEESQGVMLAELLSKTGRRVTVYDPASMDNAKKALKRVTFAKTAKAAVKNKDAVCLTTPWKEFTKLKPSDMKRGRRKTLLIDCWRLLDTEAFAKTCDIAPLGVWRPSTKSIKRGK